MNLHISFKIICYILLVVKINGGRIVGTKVKLIMLVLIFLLYLPTQTLASKHDDIVRTAKNQLGVPYLFGGTTPRGFDCSGFIGYVFQQHGINLPRTANEQFQAGRAVRRSELVAGDLVFFETYKPGPSHSGIYIGNGQFISATSSRGIAIASVNDPFYWGPRFLGARRILQEQELKQTLSNLPPGMYHDVPENHWAFSHIKLLGEQKIINGFPNSLFKPSDNLTRAQAATIIANVKGLETQIENMAFTDVSSEFWAFNAINATYDAGYFNGFQDGTFRPNAYLTREQIAVLFSRVFTLAEGEEDITFRDISESDWSYSAIRKLAINRITLGFDDHTYRPREAVTRAQFAVFLYRVLQ